MKRGKDEDKDDAALINSSNNNNNNSKTNKESPNIGSNSTDANSSGNNNTPCTVRTTGRVKKPKQVYDPSDNYVSRGSRNSLPAAASSSQSQATPANANALQQQSTVSQSPASSQSQSQSEAQPQAQSSASQSKPANQQAALAAERPSTSAAKEDAKETVPVPTVEQQRNFDTCMKCGKSEAKRGSGYKSNFLTCKSCALKWHFACLPITFEVLTNARKKFKCEKCRRCFTCMSNKAKDKVKEMIMCSICANAYHLGCHWPAIMRDKLNDPKWKCDTCCPNYNPYNGEADEVTKIQPKSPPRKSKAGRKKRATSDPAAAAVVAKKAALQQSHNKNENTENSKPIIISNNNNNNSNNIKNNNDNNTNKPSTIVSQTPDNDDVVQVISKDEIDVVNGIIDLAPLTNYSSDTSLPTLTFVVSQEDKETDDSVEIIEDVEDIVVVSASLSPPVDEQILSTETVQTWSIDDVVDYVEKFYPREADVFRTQEIDGAALMVLSRQDVIDRFGLKLGPALRIYELVLSLQTSTDDVSIGWCD
ncbi:PREDICTED: transcriptional repressor NF-X1 homolog [Drosophila arizonae]|uniref:Transcriptional repressor NF-X1 homolog n=1 Tax=Drosophila arizonae TaxID=7263 RepID=A0ABM1PT65_DROAR|nr:PREDICTED: transcriptional repressor NF-X1 homolog [Drosophila arizonae]